MRIKRISITEERSLVLYDLNNDTVSFKSANLDLEPLFKNLKQKYLSEVFRNWVVRDFTVYYDKQTYKIARCIIGVSLTKGEEKTIFRQEIVGPDPQIIEDCIDAISVSIKHAMKLHMAGF